MRSINYRSFRLIALAICLAAFLSACGQEKTPVQIESDCRSEPGGACTIESNGGPLHWNLSKLRPGQEYIVAFLSKAPITNFDRANFGIKLQTDRPSASPPVEELNRIANMRRSSTRMNFTAIAPQEYDRFDSVNRVDLQNVNSNVIDYVIHSPTDQNAILKRTKMGFFDGLPGIFELRLDLDDFRNPAISRPSYDANYLEKLNQCLKFVMPQVYSYLGAPPVSLNSKNPNIGDRRTVIALTDLRSKDGSGSAGFFAQRDIFNREGERPIENSNRGEFITLSKQSDYSNICSTAAHEFQHLINALYKLVMPLAPQARGDREASIAAGYQPEHSGIDEGLAHIFEEFSGERHSVPFFVNRFLTQVNGTPLPVALTGNDAELNKRSRGLNVLIQYYAIRLAGGRLNTSDAKTRDYLASRIKSPKIGFQNIADYFNQTESEFFRGFFVHLARVARGLEPASEFIPPMEGSVGRSSGIHILDYGRSLSDFASDITTIHPAQIEIPLIGNITTASVPAQSVGLFRYIVPESVRSQGGYLDLSTDGSAYTVYLIPLK